MATATSFDMLPEECVSTILSLTSPPDACRLMMASSWFRSIAESDVIWDSFLPPDHTHIVSRSSFSPANNCSKKELFSKLCNSILIDGGSKSFSLEKSGGKKCYFLSARALSISLSNEPNHWSWTSHDSSRFSEVIELKTIQSIEIEGKMNTRELSRNTTYGAYLIIKVCEHAFGLEAIPWEISVSVGDRVVADNTAFLCERDEKRQQLESLFFMNRRRMMEKRVIGGDGRRPSTREDGWMEIELGEFFVGEKYEDVKMRLVEVKGHQLKGGVIIEGIQVRRPHKCC